VRNTCVPAVAALFCVSLPSIAEKNVNVEGDLTCDGCSYHGDCTIELQESMRIAPLRPEYGPSRILLAAFG
jgi:hypothetical protein